MAARQDVTTKAVGSTAQLAARYRAVRAQTEALAAPLSPEDQQLQSMPDASPTKWHRAHTSWFFETFLLQPHLAGYDSFDANYGYLFNSYYEAVGPRHPRPARGLLSRPAVVEIAAYRAHVDAAMAALLAEERSELAPLIELGLHHEQQHQELLLTDIKHALSLNPLRPAYSPPPETTESVAPPQRWLMLEAGIRALGHGGVGFGFDNETPAHAALIAPARIATRPVSVGEYLDFIADAGYGRPEFWLSDGWAALQQQGWQAPAYWQRDGAVWYAYTLHGLLPLRVEEPVCHVSYYEAAAFASWAGKRLPTEFEWEAAARDAAAPRGLPPRLTPHPRPLSDGFFGDVWEWTASAYLPYPGFRPAAGAVGEYNGKFMVGQMVLRGRSCATPPGHERATYRNFFPPSARWQFSGFRLAEDA